MITLKVHARLQVILVLPLLLLCMGSEVECGLRGNPRRGRQPSLRHALVHALSGVLSKQCEQTTQYITDANMCNSLPQQYRYQVFAPPAIRGILEQS